MSVQCNPSFATHKFPLVCIPAIAFWKQRLRHTNTLCVGTLGDRGKKWQRLIPQTKLSRAGWTGGGELGCHTTHVLVALPTWHCFIDVLCIHVLSQAWYAEVRLLFVTIQSTHSKAPSLNMSLF